MLVSRKKYIFVKKERKAMSKKLFKKLVREHRVIAIPTRKKKNADDKEVQLYDIVPMKLLSLYD